MFRTTYLFLPKSHNIVTRSKGSKMVYRLDLIVSEITTNSQTNKQTLTPYYTALY